MNGEEWVPEQEEGKGARKEGDWGGRAGYNGK